MYENIWLYKFLKVLKFIEYAFFVINYRIFKNVKS